ncbi:hypothetical protein M2138_001218 [Dysgonomonadaceae bacterium PH5-43]|nr:hypothetical protein [Dysgonomonadaceae bacterium PH5-43]
MNGTKLEMFSEEAKRKAKEIKSNLHTIALLGYVLIGISWHVYSSKWLMIVSILVAFTAFTASMYYALSNRKFEKVESHNKLIFIEGVRGIFFSALLILVCVGRFYIRYM